MHPCLSLSSISHLSTIIILFITIIYLSRIYRLCRYTQTIMHMLTDIIITFENRYPYRVKDVSKKQLVFCHRIFLEGILPNPFKPFTFALHGSEHLSHRGLSHKCSGSLKMKNLRFHVCFQNWFRLSTDTPVLSKTLPDGESLPKRLRNPKLGNEARLCACGCEDMQSTWLAKHCLPFPGIFLPQRALNSPPTEHRLGSTSYLLSCSELKEVETNFVMH